MSAPHRLALVSLVVLTLAACGGNSSSTPAPGPNSVNPPASQAESGNSSCVTSAAGVSDSPTTTQCAREGLDQINFVVVDYDTDTPTTEKCLVSIASNGDISLSVPALGGSMTLAGNAAGRHTHYIETEDGHNQLRVWTGTNFDREAGPFFELDSPVGSEKVSLFAVPLKLADGDYKVKCVGTATSN